MPKKKSKVIFKPVLFQNNFGAKKYFREYIPPQNFIAFSLQGSQQNKDNDVNTNKSNNKVENGMEKNNGDKVRTESMSSNNTDHIHNIDEDKINDQNSSTNKEYQDKRQDDLNKYRISTSLSSRVKNEQAIQLVVELFGDQSAGIPTQPPDKIEKQVAHQSESADSSQTETLSGTKIEECQQTQHTGNEDK